MSVHNLSVRTSLAEIKNEIRYTYGNKYVGKYIHVEENEVLIKDNPSKFLGNYYNTKIENLHENPKISAIIEKRYDFRRRLLTYFGISSYYSFGLYYLFNELLNITTIDMPFLNILNVSVISIILSLYLISSRVDFCACKKNNKKIIKEIVKKIDPNIQSEKKVYLDRLERER